MAAITRTLRPFSCGIHSDESERDLGNPSTNSPWIFCCRYLLLRSGSIDSNSSLNQNRHTYAARNQS